MFDIDNTLTKNGAWLNKNNLLELLQYCRKSNFLTAINTNRPIPVLMTSELQFDRYYGNSSSFCGVPYVGALVDWLLSREYQNKIRNMKSAQESTGCIPLLLDDNAKSIREATARGHLAVHTPQGITPAILDYIKSL